MLKEKIAIVTGCEGGIGQEIVKKFKENNAFTIGIDLKENSRNVDEYYKLDIFNTNECDDVIKQIISRHNAIDILVNCAGVTADAMTKKMSEEQFDYVVDINLKGTWNITRLIGPIMQDNHRGTIINISSIVGIYGNIGQANYAASKAGLIGMTKTWAKEFALKGGNVRVNAVAPGYTMTDMIKTVPHELLEKFSSKTLLGRLAYASEIANTVLFLASDLSSYITGETINVNGGMTL